MIRNGKIKLIYIEKEGQKIEINRNDRSIKYIKECRRSIIDRFDWGIRNEKYCQGTK